ncbi:hypothetical protein PHISP_08256 [Aspergillus sp. HF37]|nr:hypothetical protein PHISP_08256 [Aspergillus sp. HF37]
MESGYEEDDSRALDECISQEQAADMALLENSSGHGGTQRQTQTGDFGSFSDDEYDHLFMDLVEGQGHEGMDTSGG